MRAVKETIASPLLALDNAVVRVRARATAPKARPPRHLSGATKREKWGTAAN